MESKPLLNKQFLHRFSSSLLESLAAAVAPFFRRFSISLCASLGGALVAGLLIDWSHSPMGAKFAAALVNALRDAANWVQS